MHALYYVATLLFAGLLGARLVSKVKLPNVTGYILAGIVVGPYLLKLIPKDVVSKFDIISEMALGFIAYSIGSQFSLNLIRKTGKNIMIITVLESLGAVVLVSLFMSFVLRQPVAFSIVLGAIAAATAPAATIMVIRQYNAKGPLVDTLLGVVAMDDATGIIAFGLCMAFAKQLISPEKVSLWQTVLMSLWEIAFALIIGGVLGLVLVFIAGRARGEDELLSMTTAMILFTAGIAEFFNVSTLLACMMLGSVTANAGHKSNRLLSIIDRITPPLFVAFFTASGADLDISVLMRVGLVGMAYIFVRVVGKMLGAWLGCKIVRYPKNVSRYLGFTLIPQAGVAIGLSMLAQSQLGAQGIAIRTIILAATVVYELVGPVITKTALQKAGEIKV
ncbi:MAG: cation:proton antiporter [Clostridia bacterium]|nr:cation/H(+) antiporter [Clostridia bacterium]